MADGEVRQVGTQRDLYERPADSFVAGFVGRSTFLSGRIVELGLFESAGGLKVRCRTSVVPGPARLALRPESVSLAGAATGLANTFDGTVDFVSYLGAATDVRVKLTNEDHVVVQTPNRSGSPPPGIGDKLSVGWPIEAALVYGD